MKEVAAIIAPSVDLDQVTREIQREHIALRDEERKLAAAETKTQSLREECARRRIEIGRRLIEAKKAIKHGGWLPYLEKLGIEARTASNWMREAGFVEEFKSESRSNDSDLPKRALDSFRLNTRVAAGIDKRPRKSDEQPDPELVADNDRSTPVAALPPTIDIDRELSRIQDKLCAAASSMPASVRKQIAHELRETARIIEEMS